MYFRVSYISNFDASMVNRSIENLNAPSNRVHKKRLFQLNLFRRRFFDYEPIFIVASDIVIAGTRIKIRACSHKLRPSTRFQWRLVGSKINPFRP